MGCCWYCQNIYTGSSDSDNDNVSLYENEQFSLSKLITSY